MLRKGRARSGAHRESFNSGKGYPARTENPKPPHWHARIGPNSHRDFADRAVEPSLADDRHRCRGRELVEERGIVVIARGAPAGVLDAVDVKRGGDGEGAAGGRAVGRDGLEGDGRGRGGQWDGRSPASNQSSVTRRHQSPVINHQSPVISHPSVTPP